MATRVWSLGTPEESATLKYERERSTDLERRLTESSMARDGLEVHVMEARGLGG